jgi:hypothetical protein
MTTATSANAEIIFESGTLGPTGATFGDLQTATVPGTNVNSLVFPGVRFELSQAVDTSQIGGHFVERMSGTFFGAIIKLDDENDFPNSSDLSTSDVRGTATLTFPDPSAEAFGNLNLSLEAGWYALVFGSGLFGASGSGGTVRNGMDIGDPSYIAFEPNLQWFNLDILQNPVNNFRFVVMGRFIPEPSTIVLLLILFFASQSVRLR